MIKINRKYILVLASALVFPFTLVMYSFFPETVNAMTVYVKAMGIYWIYIISFTLILSKGDVRKLLFFKGGAPSASPLWMKGIPFLPVPGVLFISFLPNVNQISVHKLMVVVFIAVVNGIVEEVYWRGLFLKEFSKSIVFGFWIPSIFFGAWHVSLWFLKGIVYHGGFGALVGGAFIMGLIWSWSSRKLQQIRFGIYAHVLVNIFAFTGLFVDNGF